MFIHRYANSYYRNEWWKKDDGHNCGMCFTCMWKSGINDNSSSSLHIITVNSNIKILETFEEN